MTKTAPVAATVREQIVKLRDRVEKSMPAPSRKLSKADRAKGVRLVTLALLQETRLGNENLWQGALDCSMSEIRQARDAVGANPTFSAVRDAVRQPTSAAVPPSQAEAKPVSYEDIEREVLAANNIDRVKFMDPRHNSLYAGLARQTIIMIAHDVLEMPFEEIAARLERTKVIVEKLYRKTFPDVRLRQSVFRKSMQRTMALLQLSFPEKWNT